MRLSTQPGAAAFAGRKRPRRHRWWLLSAAVLLALIFAGSAYGAQVIYYFEGYANPGTGGGDNTLYYRNFNDSCSDVGYGYTRSIYANGNGSWVASVVAFNNCAYNKAHLGPSSDYGITYAESKCTNADSVVLYLVCWTTRPSGIVTAPSAASTEPTPATGSWAGTLPVAAFGSSTAPPASDPAAVQNLADDVGRVPTGETNGAGAPLTDQARDLVRNVGTSGDTLAAFPTTSGEVCYEVEGNGSCGFVDGRAPYGAGIAFSMLWDRNTGETRVFGVAADQVKSVDVEIAGVEHPAVLDNNGFYYQLPDGVPDTAVQQILATWTDGSVHAFPVNP